MMMALGTFVFSLTDLAFQQLQRSSSWRHPSSERVGARAARQYVGPGDESITLQCLIAPQITGSILSIDTLREMANEGRPLAMVDGTGYVYGAFVIEQLEEDQTLHFWDGAPRRIDFQITLKRVGDEALAEIAEANA